MPGARAPRPWNDPGHRRGVVPRKRAWALLTLLLAAAGVAWAGDGGGAPVRDVAGAPATARIVDEGQVLLVEDDPGEIACRLGLEAWRERAAADFAAAFEEPPRIGDQEKRPDQFERFGAAATSPDGARTLFSVSTYAMATTLSLVGLLDTHDCSLELVPAAYRGTIEAPSWSPDARHVAFALGTARAAGEALAVVDAAAVAPTLSVERDALAAALGAARPGAWARDDPRGYTPHVRDLSWQTNGSLLSFVTDPPGDGDVDAPSPGPGLRWRTGPDGGLELVE